MNKFSIVSASIIAALIAAPVHAFEFGKPITTSVNITSPAHKGLKQKQVMLMNIKLTPRENQMLLSYKPKAHKSASRLDIPQALDLGMNNVPVLDQGFHGSCVTFAVTAALDAALGKGDYISQLCSLELGSYLEQKSYYPSGWNGTLGSFVMDQMTRFGIVNKDKQEFNGCAGLNDYPLRDFRNEGKPMSLDEYKTMSEDISFDVFATSHMNAFQRFSEKFLNTDEADVVLNKTKLALAKGNRLTFGTFLVISPYCNAGACASFKTKQDTWALTLEIETPPYFTGGHEMVIIGYDDNGVATDQEGREHKGLLTIRNSWGSEVGDHGNFYMTYDYFKKFVMEVQEIKSGVFVE